MRYLFSIVFVAFGLVACAQQKETVKVLANTKLLEQTVFGSKDSATLEKLFAQELKYEHSSGKVESREEAIHNISHNRSVYTKSPDLNPYNIKADADSLKVQQVYKAIEKKADGTESALNLAIETVWIKEKKDWKLARRKATKIKTD